MSNHFKNASLICLTLLIAVPLAGGLTGCSSSDDDGGTTPTVDTTAPAQISSFLALPGDGRVTLSWINPQDQDFSGVEVRRATDAMPTRSTGDVVYDNTATTYIDDSVVNDQIYYYAAFTHDNDSNYSAGIGTSCTPHVAAAVVITDENLELALRSELGIPSDDITDLAMATLLEFDGNGLGIADLQGIQYAVNLSDLSLRSNSLTNSSNLQLLAQLTKLEKLTLSSNEFTILPNLSALAMLEILYITDIPISSLGPLGGVTSLKRLQFGLCDVSDLAPLANLANLENLSFSDTDVSSLGPLSALSNLTTLDASRSLITSAEPVSGLANLTRLFLTYTNIADLSPIATMSQLTALGLDSAGLDDVTLLAGLTGLTYLGLNSNDITDLAPLAGMAGMKHMQLGNNKISDLSPLSSMTGLEYCMAENNLISDVTVFHGLSDLISIGVVNNPLPRSAVENDLVALENRGVEVMFMYDVDMLPLMGPWAIGSVTVNGTPTEPGVFFEWDAATVTNTLTILPFGAYMAQDLDAGGNVVYIETGYLTIDGTSVTVTSYTEDGEDITPREAFAGTWARSGEDLVLTGQEGPDTVVLTWVR
jgi:internalin A